MTYEGFCQKVLDLFDDSGSEVKEVPVDVYNYHASSIDALSGVGYSSIDSNADLQDIPDSSDSDKYDVKKLNITRKTVQKTGIQLLIIFAEISIMVGYLISCLINSIAILAGIVCFMALTFVCLEYISEDKVVYLHWRTAAKFWWLGLLITVSAVILMKIYFK